MITARTVTIVGIIVVLFSAGVFFYTEYSNQRFEANLPSPPAPFVSEQDGTLAQVEPLKEDTPMRHHTPQPLTPLRK